MFGKYVWTTLYKNDITEEESKVDCTSDQNEQWKSTTKDISTDHEGEGMLDMQGKGGAQ